MYIQNIHWLLVYSTFTMGRIYCYCLWKRDQIANCRSNGFEIIPFHFYNLRFILQCESNIIFMIIFLGFLHFTTEFPWIDIFVKWCWINSIKMPSIQFNLTFSHYVKTIFYKTSYNKINFLRFRYNKWNPKRSKSRGRKRR